MTPIAAGSPARVQTLAEVIADCRPSTAGPVACDMERVGSCARGVSPSDPTDVTRCARLVIRGWSRADVRGHPDDRKAQGAKRSDKRSAVSRYAYSRGM